MATSIDTYLVGPTLLAGVLAYGPPSYNSSKATRDVVLFSSFLDNSLGGELSRCKLLKFKIQEADNAVWTCDYGSTTRNRGTPVVV